MEDMDLRELLDNESHRLRGVQGWEALEVLGAGNVERILALARKGAHQGFARGDARATLRARARAIRRVEAALEVTPRERPILPRLRNGLFRAGDAIALYLGDTPGHVGGPWREVEIEQVAKAFCADWSHDPISRGYYWRSTVRASDGRALLPGHGALAFSTTEPRALLARDFEALAGAGEAFLSIFCANAWRDWTPLWCLEFGLECDAGAMDMRRWLRHAS